MNIPDGYIDTGDNHECKACEHHEKSQLAPPPQVLVTGL